MKETLDAIYENGLLRPLRKLDAVEEGQRLRLTLEIAEEDEGKRHRLSDLAGCLSTSARFSQDPVEAQRKLRDEWS